MKTKPLKQRIENENDNLSRSSLVNEYKHLQKQIQELIIQEKTTKIEQRFQKNTRGQYKNPVLEGKTNHFKKSGARIPHSKRHPW